MHVFPIDQIPSSFYLKSYHSRIGVEIATHFVDNSYTFVYIVIISMQKGFNYQNSWRIKRSCPWRFHYSH